MRVSPKPGACAALLVLTGVLGACSPAPAAVADGDGIPVYEVDPTWPPELPNNWILGEVRGLFVEENDHLWVLHMPSSLGNREIGAALDPPISDCCVPAPRCSSWIPRGTSCRPGAAGRGNLHTTGSTGSFWTTTASSDRHELPASGYEIHA